MAGKGRRPHQKNQYLWPVCGNGHVLDDETTVLRPDGTRECAVCRLLAQRKRRGVTRPWYGKGEKSAPVDGESTGARNRGQ